MPYQKFSPEVGVVLPAVALFLIPAFCLAMISPVVYKLALRDLTHTGAVVGRLGASNALGAIAGTFATGFWLIPSFGTRTIVLGVGTSMVLLGLLALPLSKRIRAMTTLLMIVLTTVVVWQQPALLRSPCKVESAYFCINVEWTSKFGTNERAKLLWLDNLIHSAANPDDPDDFWYGYERTKAWVLASANHRSPSGFFIGGGGYTLPSWMERNLSQSVVEVAEIDPAVTRIALEEFIPADTAILSHNGDARQVLQRIPPGPRYHVVVGDAFNDITVPYHLTTVEFARLIKDRLTPDGIYMANIVDFRDGAFQGAFTRTLAQVFPHVYVISEEVRTTSLPSTMVVVASSNPLPWGDWQLNTDLQVEVEERGSGGTALILTDDYAPVDNLLLPVFAARW